MKKIAARSDVKRKMSYESLTMLECEDVKTTITSLNDEILSLKEKFFLQNLSVNLLLSRKKLLSKNHILMSTN